MAKLNKELQENLKEINNVIFKMAEIENDFIISTNIHDEMIVVSINSVKNEELECLQSKLQDEIDKATYYDIYNENLNDIYN